MINSTISFIEENNAGNAAAALMARLAPKAKVFYFMFVKALIRNDALDIIVGFRVLTLAF